MTVRAYFVALLMVGLAASQAAAQESRQQLDAAIRTTVARIRAGGPPFGPGADSQVMVRALTVTDEQLLAAAEENRIDKQLGSESNAAGSTSLVAKGGVPRILAFALENGALAQEQSGTTLTLKGTPVGLIRALADKGYVDSRVSNDRVVGFLQRFAFGASFDTSRGVAEGAEPQFTGSDKQLSSLTARLSIVDERDPARAAHDAQWNNLAASAGVAVATASKSFVGAVAGGSDPAFTAWLTSAQAALAQAAPAQLEAVLREQLVALRAAPLAAPTRLSAKVVRDGYDALLAGRKAILDEAAEGLQLALDYTNERPAKGSETNSVRLVGSLGGLLDLTGNVSSAFYSGTLPAGVGKRLRDVRAAVQLDLPIGQAETIGRYVLTFAYKLDYFPEDIIGPAGVLLAGSKGTMSVGQVKLTMPIKGSAARIPLSITFGDKSEVDKEKVVRGNIGFTYDLDAVFARFKP